MRKSSIIILFVSIISIIIGLYLLQNADLLVVGQTLSEYDKLPVTTGNLFLVGIIPFIIVFTMDIIATLEAEEVKPFIKDYDRIKYVICFGFQLLFAMIIIAQLYAINEKYITGLILAVVITYVGYSAPRIPRNQVLGFKNKWTLANDYVWGKVHIRIRSLSYLISLVVVTLTFSRHFAVVTIAIILIALSIGYLIYYSYKLYKQDLG